MCAVGRAVEQLYNLALDTLCLHLDPAKKFIPCVECGLPHASKIKGRYLRFGVGASLCFGNERDTDAHENRGLHWG